MSTAYISVIEPVGKALDWTRRVLFQPFDIAKWFVIGFCAWLATLGEGGFSGGNFNPGSHHGGGPQLDRVKSFVVENLYWLVPVIIIVVLVSVTLGILFLWLRSRGQFMFLDCVATNRAVVAEPWRAYARQGNSLFVFLLVLGLATFAVILPLLVGLGGSIYLMVEKRDPVPLFLGIVLVAICVVLLLAVAIASAVITKLTRDFVVPVMYLRRNRCMDAWREFGHVARNNLGNILLYILFQIVLCLAIGFLTLVLVLATCCIAGCFLIIPYLGTVLLLPILVFKRAYSATYLAQYGPEWDVFLPGRGTQGTASAAPTL